jgi:hypothetical protein
MKEMTLQQNPTRRKGLEKPTPAWTQSPMTIVTEAHEADATGTCTGGDHEAAQAGQYERLCARFATTLGTLICVLVLFAVSASAATYTVNSKDDLDDGVCNAAHCGLRKRSTPPTPMWVRILSCSISTP